MVFEPVSAANKKDWVYRGSDADGSAAGTVGLPKSRWERKGYTIAAQELPKGYPRATQGIPKGYPRDTQGIPKGYPREQHARITGATPDQRRGGSEFPKPPNACSEAGFRSGLAGSVFLAGCSPCRALFLLRWSGAVARVFEPL